MYAIRRYYVVYHGLAGQVLVSGGILEVQPQVVTVLADTAILV